MKHSKMPKARRYLVKLARDLKPGDILIRRGFPKTCRVGHRRKNFQYLRTVGRSKRFDASGIWLEEDLCDSVVLNVIDPHSHQTVKQVLESDRYVSKVTVETFDQYGADTLKFDPIRSVLILNPNYLEEKKVQTLWKLKSGWYERRAARRVERKEKAL